MADVQNLVEKLQARFGDALLECKLDRGQVMVEVSPARAIEVFTALRDELDSLQRRLQLPMILITHDPEDARQLGDHIIHLQDGQVLREELAGAPGARQIRPERASASSGVPHVRSALPVAT